MSENDVLETEADEMRDNNLGNLFCLVEVWGEEEEGERGTVVHSVDTDDVSFHSSGGRGVGSEINHRH